MADSWGRPRRLTPEDDTGTFTCGESALDTWFRRFALTSQSAGMSTVFVSEFDGSIAGFYALATGGLAPVQAPERARRGVPEHPLPVIILARLGVAIEHQGQGLGRALVVDACRRVAEVSRHVGVRALLIHAKGEDARSFYLSIGEFDQSPTDPLHLVLLMKDLKTMLTDAE